MTPGWTPPGKGQQVDHTTPGFDMPFARACVVLGVVPNTMVQWRRLGVGPNWRKAGPHRNDPLYYSETEIAAVREDMARARSVESKDSVRHRIERASKARAKRPRKQPTP